MLTNLININNNQLEKIIIQNLKIFGAKKGNKFQATYSSYCLLRAVWAEIKGLFVGRDLFALNCSEQVEQK